MSYRTLLIIFALFFSTHLLAEEDDPIDTLVEQEIEAAESLGGTAIRPDHIVAYIHGQKLWDAELNKTYKEIMTLISPEEKLSLRFEQRKWIKERDIFSKKVAAEREQENGSGPMAELETEGEKMRFIRARVIELRKKLHTLQEPNNHKQRDCQASACQPLL